MDILEGLNEAQKEAVQTTAGPVLILAGAGSGKTKTLTHRIAYILTHDEVWPDEILAVTFTNKAAKEMRERLSNLTKEPNTRSFMPWMGTFHGICVRLLRADGQAIGVEPNFVIYDEDDRRGLIRQIIKELGMNADSAKPSAVSSAISTAKNEMITASEYAEDAVYPFQKSVAKIYAKYEVAIRKAGALDFDDLLIKTVELLRESKETRAKYQKQFKHILIDEYQDTNAAQYAIVKSLVGKDKNICVVGDDWQSIYSWRGADFKNILNFERDFPGAKVVKLEENYRSTGSILEAAQNVINKNIERTDKKLWTKSGQGSPVQVQGTYDEIEEALLVANRINTEVASGNRNYGDFAVLYRLNAASYAFERAFMQYRIPYQLIGGVRFYDRKEVKDIVAYLKLIYQPNDRMSFTRIVNVPTRGIGAVSLEKFLVWQAQSNMDIIAALTNVESAGVVTPRAAKSFASLGDTLRRLQVLAVQESNPSEIIDQLVKSIRYKDYLQDGSLGAEEREANLSVLVTDAKSFATLADFLAEVSLMSSADLDGSVEKVNLMTVHAAKGLEFPVVFIVGMEEGIFPHSRAFDMDASQLEEERRLCYVGMTRAREELFLTYAASRQQYGQRAYSMPSRFISDMGEVVASIDRSTSNYFENEYGTDFIPDFDIGDRVRSRQFGDGEIVDIDGLAVAVRFDDGATKKLNVEYARLEKI